MDEDGLVCPTVHGSAAVNSPPTKRVRRAAETEALTGGPPNGSAPGRRGRPCLVNTRPRPDSDPRTPAPYSPNHLDNGMYPRLTVWSMRHLAVARVRVRADGQTEDRPGDVRAEHAVLARRTALWEGTGRVRGRHAAPGRCLQVHEHGRRKQA